MFVDGMRKQTHQCAQYKLKKEASMKGSYSAQVKIQLKHIFEKKLKLHAQFYHHSQDLTRDHLCLIIKQQ